MSIKNKYKILPVTHRECKEWFLMKHYAKRIPMSSYLFGLYTEYVDSLMPSLELQGVISFGISGNYNLNDLLPGFTLLELNRLVVNEGLEKNTLSYFVSTALNMLDKPVAVISYSDLEKQHNGYIYQATNWIYTGSCAPQDVYEKDGIQMHGKTFFDKFGTRSEAMATEQGFKKVKTLPKHRYFYFLGTKKDIKKMKSLLPYQQQPYPKGDNLRYNADFKPQIQLRYDL
jgi:hypothetical protein